MYQRQSCLYMGMACMHAAVQAPRPCSAMLCAAPLNGVFYARLMCLYSCSNAGALQGLSLPSPYLDIVSMSQRRAPSEDTRTARLIFDHALMVHQEAVADPPVLLDITYKSLLLCCLLGTNSRSALHSLWPYCGHPAGKPARNNFER